MARWRVLATFALEAAGLAACGDDDDAAVVTTAGTVPVASELPGAPTTAAPSL